MKVWTARGFFLPMALVGALALAACSSGGDAANNGAHRSTATPARGGTLVIAEGEETAEMDPATSLSDMTWRLQSLVYETLVTTDAKSEIVPDVAESWKQPSATRYVFSLRPGVTFSNGRALTADDVVGSLKRVLDPKTASYWTPQMGPVKSVKAIGAATVQIDLKAPYAPFLASLTNVAAAILPMTELADGSFDPTKTMLGTGPFLLRNHVADQQWTFARNPHYWHAGFPILDSVEVRIAIDDAARVAALRDGSVDVAYFGAPDAPALLKNVPNVGVTVQEGSGLYGLILNAVGPDSPFRDVRVRQAVAYALDRNAIIATALAGTGRPTAIAPAGQADACAADGLPTYARDVEQAKALLAQAGAEHLKFKLIAPSFLPSLKSIAQVVQQNLADAGIEATITTPELGKYVQSVYVDNPATFEGVIDTWVGYLDPVMSMQYLIPDRSPATAGFTARDPGLIAAIDAAAVPAPEADRKAAIVAACKAAAEDANIIPIATMDSTIAVRTDKVVGTVAKFDPYANHLRDIASFGLVNH